MKIYIKPRAKHTAPPEAAGVAFEDYDVNAADHTKIIWLCCQIDKSAQVVSEKGNDLGSTLRQNRPMPKICCSVQAAIMHVQSVQPSQMHFHST